MRIIDKNTDFYDYLQGLFPDKSITFDRTDSFVLTKEKMCDYLASYSASKLGFVLLQVCNSFWLFLLEVTKESADHYIINKPTEYSVELLHHWRNYDKPRRLIDLSFIQPKFELRVELGGYAKERIESKIPLIVKSIDTNDFEICCRINQFVSYRGGTRFDRNDKIEKHIPLLKASGIAEFIDPLTIYLSLEEYFSLEISSSERTESTGITDKEKVVNHGFDAKTSFRGKIEK